MDNLTICTVGKTGETGDIYKTHSTFTCALLKYLHPFVGPPFVDQ